MGVWKGPMGVKMGPKGFSFTGQYEFAQSGGHWEIALKSSGTFRFKAKVESIDVFVVDGGSNGAAGSLLFSDAVAGKGGDGGMVKTHSAVSVSKGTDYPVVIGGAGQPSSGFGVDATGGTKKSGGNGSYADYDGSVTSATAGTDGTLAFGESGTLIGGSTVYGSSGGGGGTSRKKNGSITTQSGAVGGDGAGSGGSADAHGDGTANPGAPASAPGSGGGGGSAVVVGEYNGFGAAGGDGASGTIIIRDHRG